MLDAFIVEASRRKQVYSLHTPAGEEKAGPAPPPSSVRAIVEKRGAIYIYDAIRLTWQEFQELYHIVKDSLEQYGRGRRRELERTNAFFVAMLFLTSGSAVKLIAVNLKPSCSLWKDLSRLV
jgi:hypothetical protein